MMLSDEEKRAHQIGYGPWNKSLLPFAIILAVADALNMNAVKFMVLVKEKHDGLVQLTQTNIGV